ncbi:molybdopterin dinucleotide binding domain-containing protein [Pararhizobium sp. IMCC21322]|uniref:molybdopterin dinucleotide binding domain-containing protein n=1 Tax=Pararhizobium sp. IMCC21322 TaxID=3067903 RepID=UPI002741D888|nr:molybdopterin dinucleotide binding domain-containing protein [Pararhizobium sp. IMCC21322]
MDLSRSEIYEIATFYAHFTVLEDDEAPLPDITLRVCDSLTCALHGAEDLLEPEAMVSMNGTDIRRMNLSAGDMVCVTTRRGSITLKLREDWELPQGLIFIPFCYAEAPANALTNPQLDPFGKIPEFKFCAVRVEALVQEAAE